MSGSGSSLFTLYDRPDDAEQAADRVSRTLSTRAVAVELAPALSDDLS
jgi:4-diphosphocytidyl-2C-methyl-D-erythritol kinase